MSMRNSPPILAMLALAGCALAPAYSPPTMPLPTSLGQDAARWPDVDWWRGFGNEELAVLIAEAQANNTDIAAAAARVDQAGAGLRIARAPLLPAINLSGNALHQGANSSSGASSGSYAYAELGASWEADLWGRLRAQARLAHAALAASRFDAEAVRLGVAAQVAETWLTAVELRERHAIAVDNLANARTLLSQASARLRAGEALAGDVAAQRAVVAEAEAQIAAFDRADAAALASLAILLGRPAQGFAIAAVSLDAIVPPAIARPGLPAELLARRPDIAAAAAALTAAGADVQAARAAMLPKISLSATGGGQIGTGPSEALYNLVAGLTQPLFDHGALAGQRDLAMGILREREAEYRRVVLAALSDVERSLKAIGQLDREAAARVMAADEAARALAEVQARYRAGSEDMVAVLDAERTLFSARDARAAIRAERLRASVALYEALGGGWVDPTPHAAVYNP